MGADKQANRQLVITAAHKLGWQAHYNNQEYAILNMHNFWSFESGSELVIIYNGKDLPINAVAFGRGRLQSPFHYFANRRRKKLFLAEMAQVSQQIK